MPRRPIRFFFIVISLFIGCQLSGQPLSSIPFASDHPRIFLEKGVQRRIKDAAEHDLFYDLLYAHVTRKSDSLLNVAPVRYEKEGFRLLPVSREAFYRIFYLSFTYQMTKEVKYAERAWREMETVCSFVDWNPSHFLDTAEMVAAVSIGYDWIFDALTAEQRNLIREAIRSEAFDPSYDSRYNGFLERTNNWNQVCNAGLVLGAIALLDENSANDEEYRIILRSVESIRKAMKTYSPDGVYPEGYQYWSYGTTYNVMMIAALESTFGSDAGLSDIPGFMKTPYFLSYLEGTTGTPFNFSDSEDKSCFFPVMGWFASKLASPALLHNSRRLLIAEHYDLTDENARFIPLALLYACLSKEEDNVSLGKMWHGQGKTPVFIVRTDWNSDKGLYLAAKGGTPRSDHGHMDGGSFVFETGNVRWATDLGTQSYYSLEKAGVNLWDSRRNGDRWKIYRYTNFVHNTISLLDASSDPLLHDPDSSVELLSATEVNPSGYEGRFDLTGLYDGQFRALTREFRVLNDSILEIEDHFSNTSRRASARWIMCTEAQVKVQDGGFLLYQDGKVLELKVATSAEYRLSVLENTPPSFYDAPNPGSRRIAIDIDLEPDSDVSLVVRMSEIK